MIFLGKKKSKQALIKLLAKFDIEAAQQFVNLMRILRDTSSVGPR